MDNEGLCPVCSAVVASRSDRQVIAWCGGCGTGVTLPPPGRDVSSDELFTEGSYAGQRLARRDQWRREADLRLEWVAGHLPSGSVLELGPATGEFCAAAQAAGYDVVGVETSRWAAEQAAELTDRVEHGDLASWRRQHPDARFDAVVLFHTLEHVSEPVDLLDSLAALLRPGGLLFLEVPNGGSRDARALNADWPLALLEDHLFHYTARSLPTLLAKSGLTTVRVTEHTFRAYDGPRTWARRRARWLKHGSFAASRDLLRAVAAAPTQA